MNVGGCGSQQSASGVVPQQLSTLFFLKAWSLLIRLDWLASEFYGVACLFLPSTVIISTYKHNCMLLSLAF